MSTQEPPGTPSDPPGLDESLRQELMHQERTAVPCPACREPVDAVTASGCAGATCLLDGERPAFTCPRCGARLERVFPSKQDTSPPWHWQLNHDWLADRLHRAALYDSQDPEGLL